MGGLTGFSGIGGLRFEIEVVVISAAGVEVRGAGGAAIGRVQILADGQFPAASPTQDSGLIRFALRPNFERMSG